jgi:cell division protein FtsX
MTGITFYRRRGRMSNDFEDGLAEIIEKNAKADAKADSWLDKIKNSSWTAVIVGGGLAVVLVLIMFAWLVG